MQFLRLQTESSYCVEVPGIDGQYGVLMVDKVERGLQDARLLCSLFGQFINLVISSNVCVSSNFADGDTVMRFFSVFTIRVMRSLSRWLYWEDGFLMWLKRRYMLFRLFLKTIVSMGNVLVFSIVIKSVYSFALRMLRYPGRQQDSNL